MINKDDIKILYIEDLAKLLGRSKMGITVQVRKNPEALPPRLVFPKTRRIMWLEKDVIEWINSYRTNKTTEDK